MKGKYADLCVTNASAKVAETAAKLGWSHICFARDLKSESFKTFAQEARCLETKDLSVYVGAIISSNIAENARRALEHADLVIVEAAGEEAFRQASESHEVDLIVGAEKYVERDPMDFRGSGLDHVMMKFMAERKIGYAIKFSDILASYGGGRIQLLGRIRQNIKLAVKYKVSVVGISGAASEYELRGPLEMAAYLSYLGLGQTAEKAVSDNPLRLLQKSEDRKNPDVITEGVKVVDWGGQQKKPKKKHGWY